jgi:hypothetical protein
VAAAYTDAFGGNTIAASNSTTFTNYTTAFFREPTAGTNVTMTNKWAIGAESARFGTSNQLTISTSGVLTATSPVFATPALGTPSSGTVTNLTGTASININGTVGATTATTGYFTTITASSNFTGATLNGGTAANDDITIQGTTNATRTTSYCNLQPNGGFVGIGTTTPALALHIVTAGASGVFRAQNTQAGGYTGFELYGDAGTQLAAFGTGNSTASFYPGEMYLGTNTAKAVRIYTTNASSVRFSIFPTGGASLGSFTDPGANNLLIAGTLAIAGATTITGNLTSNGALITVPQALLTAAGVGVVNLTTLTTEVTTTGVLDALSLANGTVGQIKTIIHKAGAFTSRLTPTTALGFTSITFLASLGQTCTLQYTSDGWVIIAVGGLTLPLIA